MGRKLTAAAPSSKRTTRSTSRVEKPESSQKPQRKAQVGKGKGKMEGPDQVESYFFHPQLYNMHSVTFVATFFSTPATYTPTPATYVAAYIILQPATHVEIICGIFNLLYMHGFPFLFRMLGKKGSASKLIKITKVLIDSQKDMISKVGFARLLQIKCASIPEKLSERYDF